MKKQLTSWALVAILMLFMSGNKVYSQTSVTYTADNTTNFSNPERGWALQFIPVYGGHTGDDIPARISYAPHAPISLGFLQQLRSLPEVMSVYMDVVKIQQLAAAIPQSRLNEIQADLNTARTAGMKVNFRICYNYGIGFGEASYYWINYHLDQLGPIIQSNADIIVSVDAGMYGGSGEACCNSGFVNETENNRWSALTAQAIVLYNKLFSFIPSSRMMLMRYPRYKYDMMGWNNGNSYPTNAIPVSSTNSFDGSMQSRLGFYDDNFAGDIDHYGFFDAWGQLDRDFAAADSKYTLVRGELSASTDFNQQNGLSEMAKYHFTLFHGLGNSNDGATYGSYDGWAEVSQYWKTNGNQYDQMTKKLGYRFTLNSATFPAASLQAGANISMSFSMTNSGWAGISNPRNFEIVLRKQSDGSIYRMVIDGDGKGNRTWLPRSGETKALTVNTTLPANIPVGTYDVLLHLADPYVSIHDRPEYSIRLANQNIWEPATGFNKLNSSITISSGGTPDNIAPYVPKG